MSDQEKQKKSVEEQLEAFQADENEIREMLTDKIRENAVLLEEMATLKNELATMKVRSLKVYEENQRLKTENEVFTNDPSIARQRALLNYKLDLAKMFIESKAFPPKMTPEQAVVLMLTGNEMGMKDLEAMNALYITNGSTDFHSKALTAVIREKGYNIQYLDESREGVTVRVFNDKEEYVEVVRKDDQILLNSRAMGFAEKNKMRFHGLRMIMSFHLAHEFKSVADPFQGYAHAEIESAEKRLLGEPSLDQEQTRLLKYINHPDRTPEEIQSVWDRAVELDLEEHILNRINEFQNTATDEEQ